jgi:hypothetical protein
MLGIFANMPAFDTNVKRSLKVNKINNKSLSKIKKFYEENKSVFDSIVIRTYDFSSSKETDVKYTKAKLIDMYGFIAGQ